MKNKGLVRTVSEAVLLVLSLVLAFGTMFVFHACGAKDDGTFMNCHNAQMRVVWFGAGSALLSIAMMIFGKAEKVAGKAITLVIQAVQAVIAIDAMLTPQVIVHMCMMNDMRCQAIMRPSVIVVCALILCAAAVHTVSLVREMKSK